MKVCGTCKKFVIGKHLDYCEPILLADSSENPEKDKNQVACEDYEEKEKG